MAGIDRSTQKWIFVAGLILLVVGVQWLAESLRVGYAIVAYKTTVHTGAVAWLALGFSLLGGAALVSSSWRHLRRGLATPN